MGQLPRRRGYQAIDRFNPACMERELAGASRQETRSYFKTLRKTIMKQAI